jgi:hypothetical protein
LSLLAFVGVVDGERVEVMGAAHLELDGTLGQQEVHDLVDLPRERQSKDGSRLTPELFAIL